YDLAISSITVTEERKESTLFSDPYYKSPIIMAVLREEQPTQLTLSDFNNATIGILSGSSFDPLSKERFPNAQRQYYSLVTDMILAVEQGKIDGYLSETTYLTAAIWEGAKIEAVGEVIDRTNAGYIFRKNENTVVREQLDTFIRNAKETGFLTELQDKWIGKAEPEEVFHNDSLTGENGTLKVAVSPDLKPLCYVKDGEIVGYEIEVLQHFAKEYGYKLEFATMTFDGILPGVVSGKYDIGAGGMTITKERAQSVDFSESYLTVDVVMVVKAAQNGTTQAGFLDEMKEDFEKTFIRESRWKMIAEGIGITMLISICSAIAGTLLGFGLYMMSRAEAKPVQTVAKAVAKVYSRIVAGTPVVVILMILFYVVFGNFRDISGILVAIIGFTLTFGAFVYDHMTVSVGSIDRGQTEAAYALGYTRNQTFFRIIFPQAMTIFMPSYCGQAVELIKATAVVGYIAVNDLTKMGDIIRSNTYEAFFPLIATAVIYFILTWIATLLLNRVKRKFEPKRRSAEEILKGVKTV
ncbi:MAG: ABC transporter permease subunit, partial [Peptococcaceae bacterium]|nr:ABC transporter permease subunit [Peptococcaceae bacterium]